MLPNARNSKEGYTYKFVRLTKYVWFKRRNGAFMNIKGISVIGGIVLVVLVVILLPNQLNSAAPLIKDDVELSDESKTELSNPESVSVEDESKTELSNPESVSVEDESAMTIMPETESPTVSDTAQMENEVLETDSGVKFYFDVNGTKHYVLSVEDSPSIEE